MNSCIPMKDLWIDNRRYSKQVSRIGGLFAQRTAAIITLITLIAIVRQEEHCFSRKACTEIKEDGILQPEVLRSTRFCFLSLQPVLFFRLQRNNHQKFGSEAGLSGIRRRYFI